jgi:hypothetical protein
VHISKIIVTRLFPVVPSNARDPRAKTVLLVDDEPDVLFAVRLALENGGFSGSRV